MEKRGNKEDLGKVSPLCLARSWGRSSWKLLRYMDSKELIDESQHSFTKGKLCLANLMALYKGVTALVDEGRANDIKSMWTCADI